MRRVLNRLLDFLFRGPRIGAPVPVPIPIPVGQRRLGALRRVLPAFLLIFLAGRAPGRSCDIAGIPLWRLVAEADLIAVARVVTSEPRSVTYTSEYGEKETVEETDLHLSVQEVWKGEAPGSIVVAFSDPGLREGDLVLAVLQSDETLIRESLELSKWIEDEEASASEDGLTEEQLHEIAVSEADRRENLRGRWHPGAGASMRRIAEADLPILSKRIAEALALQTKGEVSLDERRAWLMAMAERRATRSDALMEMMYGGFAEGWQQGTTDYGRSIEVLTEEELARIVAGVVAEPSGDYELIELIDFFEGRADAAFDRAVASAVEGMLARSRADESTALAVKAAVMRVTAPESPIDVHVTQDIEQLRSVWTEVLDRWGISRPSAAAVPEMEREPE